MMRVPGVIALPHAPEQTRANRHVASTALVTAPDGIATFASGSDIAAPSEYCQDVKCPDYARDDFPQDRPHYHLGARVAAPIEIVFAESKSKRK